MQSVVDAKSGMKSICVLYTQLINQFHFIPLSLFSILRDVSVQWQTILFITSNYLICEFFGQLILLKSWSLIFLPIVSI
jgi:hypothetical protein